MPTLTMVDESLLTRVHGYATPWQLGVAKVAYTTTATPSSVGGRWGSGLQGEVVEGLDDGAALGHGASGEATDQGECHRHHRRRRARDQAQLDPQEEVVGGEGGRDDEREHADAPRHRHPAVSAE